MNPYGVAVAPVSEGNLVNGDVLVSNLNNSANLQGPGNTIVEVSRPGVSLCSPVPVLAAEIEGERERDNCLAYSGGDVVPVDVFVEEQRPPEH